MASNNRFLRIFGFGDDRAGDKERAPGPSPSTAATILSGPIVHSAGTNLKIGTREILAAYSQFPWLRAIVGKISGSVGTTCWRLYVVRNKQTGKALYTPKIQRAARDQRLNLLTREIKKGDLEEIDDHPLLDLLRNGNERFLGSVVLKLTQQYIEMNGEAYWLLERDGRKRPKGIWPLPSFWIKSLPDPEAPYYQVDINAVRYRIPETEILRFYDPDPLDPYGRGSGISLALADELETDEVASKHVKNFFLNRARPDLIISGDGIQRADTKRLEEYWQQEHKGFWNAFKPVFLSRKLDIKEIGNTFEDMQLVDLRKFERDICMQVFGIPPEKLGVLNACHDDKTECLTRDGFKFHTELTVEDEVATLNPASGKIEYHKPKNVFEYDYDGELHHWHGQRFDVMVTPNHRMYAKRYSQDTYSFSTSADLINAERFFFIHMNEDGSKEDVEITTADLDKVVYKGKVWCVEVANGIFFTRRNGKIGIHGNSNRSTIAASDLFWTKDILMPRIENIREVLQAKLIPMYDKRLILDFESPIVEDAEQQLNVMKSMPGAYTINEWRQMADIPSLGEEGEKHILRAGEIIVSTLDDTPTQSSDNSDGQSSSDSDSTESSNDGSDSSS